MRASFQTAVIRMLLPWTPLARRLMARGPSRHRAWTRRAPSRSTDVPPVPRLIWSYWHDDDPPAVVRACIGNWRRHAPEWEIRLLHRDTVAAALGEQRPPDGFEAWPAYRQADWLRVALVGRHGGIWLDASLFLTRSPEWLRRLAQDVRGFAGFHLRGEDLAGRPHAWPFLENWCFAAPPGDRFVRAWEIELRCAMAQGEAAYIAQLGADRERLLAGIDARGRLYLIMHVAARVVLGREGPFDMHLLPAEDSAFFYQSRTGWRRWRLVLALLGWGRPEDTPLVKLRGPDRQRLGAEHTRCRARPDSIVARELPDLVAGGRP